jgi:nifR3 family TIM-barrel protein
VRLGPLTLQSNLFLSPLAGYTNLPFRLVVRELGGVGLATTDLVNARSLLEKRSKALQLIQSCAADRPLAVQLFGSVPEEMRDAAAWLESIGIASVDVNMGCPARKVCRVGGGSAMLTELPKTARLVRGMVDAVKIPVTAKMRLGWDDRNLTAPDLARALEDAGLAAVFVHGRTREQGFGGRVSLAGIRAVVQAVKFIPVIGNGDVTTPQAAKTMLDETGCAGVSIGRGAFYDPWIFTRTQHYLKSGGSATGGIEPLSHPADPRPPNLRPLSESGRDALSTLRPDSIGTTEDGPRGRSRPGGTGPARFPEGDGGRVAGLLPEPTFDERVRVLCRHLDLMVEVFGEEAGCRMFRKVAPWYARRFGPANEFNKHVVRISSRAGFLEVLENYRRWRRQFLDERGELLPRFRPRAPVSSFMQEPGMAPAGQIPVPKGPVEVW